ncbi:deacetylase [Alkalihalobacillus alcalophilus ATCC 27647 = CGMCC 1.3604]|uniref:Deacetylase n=1 Tax=Alkalihalobacillus alcalophilus ATCC 27647 = CGMCC 1.3604 TaxID=1218173 RepID=A0A094YZX2_ALKAL|nr:bacillithiol biosynthesis deacetylase BshB1 [Alkalihalobacillus alcalophilus]KGA99117.1 deacetylase [Alkalihalobacillus alcalophilus ATCC 27647 = CGMCC 1.3604]MED1563459.1 bacillithiol biosynthesis deacetylase BshB1 [Alkalihalobacillus alcalophilus]THG90320.1 deacetylase [Alkalihalobacillus alcalophilus ATCC 27647 = CGMCC 1.3604]
MNKVDVLAFGAHPDDVEIGMGATLAKLAQEGKTVAICNLTYAELSSNGTVQERQEEAKKAAEILKVSHLLQLDLKDRGLKYVSNEQLAKIVAVIRECQPRIVFAPYHVDRHPDHGHCFELVKEALFNARIRRYEANQSLQAHIVEDFYTYFINGCPNPDFVLDVSDFYDQKKAALQAYQSQFQKRGDDAVETPLTNGYMEVVSARERLYGKEAGVMYAEGFKTIKPLKLDTL